MDALDGQPTTPPSLYIDLEGINLSRNGSISILQVFVSSSRRTYLVDIHTLRNKAFSTPGTNGCTLKDILESDVIPKVFFDVRNDSDARLLWPVSPYLRQRFFRRPPPARSGLCLFRCCLRSIDVLEA